jgi:hypothetical protein
MIILYIFACLLGIVLIGLYIRSAVWAYHDAEKRGQSGLLVALLVLLFFWPSGLLLWISFRPEAINTRSMTKALLAQSINAGAIRETEIFVNS